MDIGGFSVESRFEHAQGEVLDEWREQMTGEIYNVAPEDHPAY